MFGLFENNKVWDKFEIKSENFLDVICTIISVDENVLWINLYDNYNRIEIIDHLPVFKKDFNRSKITLLEKEENMWQFSMEAYKEWKNGKWWIFNKTIEEILDSLPNNSIVYLKEKNSNIRDYTIIKQKWVSTKAIFSNDWRNIIWFYPLNKRVLFPEITSHEWDIIINHYDFVKYWTININSYEVQIWYYDYSETIWWNFDLEMFNFSYDSIDNDTHNILKIIKIFDKEILSFKIWWYLKINDFEIEYDVNTTKYIFRWFKNEYILPKNTTELLLTKYVILLNKFIKEKGINYLLNIN